MTIAVKAKRGVFPGAGEGGAHALERELGNARPRGGELLRDETAREQEAARLLAEALDVDRRPDTEIADASHRVDAADESPDPFERLRVVELGRAPALPRVHGPEKAIGSVQRLSVECQRCDDRNLAFGKLERERVLLENLRFAPTIRAIELRNYLILSPRGLPPW